jgi:serpin B
VTPAPTAWPSIAPADFQMARGSVSMARPAADKGAAAATRINDFGFDLFRHLDAKGNLCVSPTSIALALAMLRPGAVGTTGTQIDTVLHQFGGSGQSAEIVALLEQLHLQTIYGDEYGGPLDPGATADPSGNPNPLIELRVANQIFSQQGMNLEKGYLDALSSFGAGVGLLDFQKDPEAARLTINKWANYATRGRIPDVLQPGDVDAMSRIAIANAIYLNAPWEEPFDPDETKPLPFTTRAGTRVNVPTMSDYPGHIDYAAGTGYRAAQMWLSYPSTLSVTIIVPDDMAAFTSSLTAAKLAGISTKLAASPYVVSLWLPRFSINTRFELTDALESMGMTAVFSPNSSDLTGVTKDPQHLPLYLQRIVHQANIDVVEEGVQAAAVTVELGGMGGIGDESPPPHVDFHVDKPFLYLVREDESGAVLFMGRVDDPSPGG